MRAQTDMKSIIEIAETFLDRDYTYRPSATSDIDHPFLDSSVAMIGNPDVIQELNTGNYQFMKIGGRYALSILDDSRAWELYKRDQRIFLQKSKEPFDILHIVTKPYRFEFLKAIINLL